MATSSGTYSAYKITNTQNGKFYIGITSRSLHKRWLEHKRHAKYVVNKGHFYRAIRKYGPNAFEIELIATFDDRSTAVEAEIQLIAELRPQYNSTNGGDGTSGHLITPEGRRKMSQVNIGNKYNLGRFWTEEQKAAMSRKKKGCPAPPISQKMAQTRANNFRNAAMKRRIRVRCENDGLVFDSMKEAACHYGVDQTAISAVCRGINKTVRGLTFKAA